MPTSEEINAGILARFKSGAQSSEGAFINQGIIDRVKKDKLLDPKILAANQAYQQQRTAFNSELYQKAAQAQLAEQVTALSEGRDPNQLDWESLISSTLAQSKYMDVAKNFKKDEEEKRAGYDLIAAMVGADTNKNSFTPNDLVNAYQQYAPQGRVTYNMLSQMPDFQEYAQKGGALKNPLWGQGKDGGGLNLLGWQPFAKEVPNKVSFYMDNVRGGRQEAYEFMTDEEVNTYNYLIGKYGSAAGDRYLNQLHTTLTARKSGEMTEQAQQDAQEHPILSTIGSVALAPGKGAGYLNSMWQAINGKEIDPNDPRFFASTAHNTIRGQVSEEIKDGIGGFGGEAAAFLYQNGMSLIDSVTMAAMTGGASAGASVGQKPVQWRCLARVRLRIPRRTPCSAVLQTGRRLWLAGLLAQRKQHSK